MAAISRDRWWNWGFPWLAAHAATGSSRPQSHTGLLSQIWNQGAPPGNSRKAQSLLVSTAPSTAQHSNSRCSVVRPPEPHWTAIGRGVPWLRCGGRWWWPARGFGGPVLGTFGAAHRNTSWPWTWWCPSAWARLPPKWVNRCKKVASH